MAELLDIDPGRFNSPEFIGVFSGSQLLDGSDPIAMIYSGHQFGQYVPQLGDGRALLLGEIEASDGDTWEIQLREQG